ncbi:alpha-glucosidase, partial [Candidatus Bathyarchaeota archaeon]|nr:alpha-glucosidase [Candidatus Bathyarchaeota archaeon]
MSWRGLTSMAAIHDGKDDGEMHLLTTRVSDGGFSLYFKNKLLLDHRPREGAPCMMIGHGDGSINTRKKHAGFNKPKEKRLKLEVLEAFEIKESTSEHACILFEGKLEVDCKVIDGRLVMEMAVVAPGDYNRFEFHLPAARDEKIYGMGEQFNYLNMRGKRVPLLTSEPGFGRNLWSLVGFLAQVLRRACGKWYYNYFPCPSFVSTSNYFMHVDSYAYSIFDFRRDDKHVVHVWEVPERIIFDVQESAPGVIGSLSEYLGRQPELPEWAISGMWLGIGGGLGDEFHSVNRKLERALDAGVKVTGIWSQDWCGLYVPSKHETRVKWDWIWDEERYPALTDFIEDLRKRGIRFLGYNNSFLYDQGELYKEAKEHGYLIKNKDGQAYDMEVGGIAKFSVGYLDLTNPDCWTWTKKWIKENMIGIGLGGWMCDFGEYLPSDSVLHSGEDPNIVHNEYPVLWAKVNAEACREMGKLGKEAGDDAIVFFNRSGDIGTSKHAPLVWAGDQFCNFSKDQGLPTVIIGGLALGFCGIGHYHSDIGGLWAPPTITRTKEVWMRWTELACFTPVMRSHEGHEYEKGVGAPMQGKNWKFDSDEETLAHLSKFSKIHEHLVPYVLHALDEYQQHGLPLIRHPYIHYEQDPILHEERCRYQYLYGRDLLVSAVIE